MSALVLPMHRHPSNRSSLPNLANGDIICGRNSGGLHFTGNRRFRVQVMMKLPQYANATSRDQKTHVIEALLSTLHTDIGARFLKKIGKNQFVLLNEKDARKKVAHTIRDKHRRKWPVVAKAILLGLDKFD